MARGRQDSRQDLMEMLLEVQGEIMELHDELVVLEDERSGYVKQLEALDA